MKTQFMNKILLFILLGFMFLLFIPNSRADLNYSTVINYDFNDQEIEIVITNDDDGEINLIITSYAIHNLNSGHFLDFPGAMLFIPEFPPSIIIEPQGSQIHKRHERRRFLTSGSGYFVFYINVKNCCYKSDS